MLNDKCNDERTNNIFLLAGEENIVEIYPNGKGRYITRANLILKIWVEKNSKIIS